MFAVTYNLCVCVRVFYMHACVYSNTKNFQQTKRQTDSQSERQTDTLRPQRWSLNQRTLTRNFHELLIGHLVKGTRKE